jgi:hypothetical protein
MYGGVGAAVSNGGGYPISVASFIREEPTLEKSLERRRHLMDATKIVILDEHSTSLRIDTEGIASTVPSNYEHIIHCPSVCNLAFCFELAMRFGQFIDSVHPFATNRATAAIK